MATTNLSGSYEFEHLSPGEYLVAARDPGFLTEDNAPTIYYPHSQRSEARTVVLGPAATVDRIDFVLPAYVNSIGQGEPTRTGLTDTSGMAVLPLSLGREYAISVALDRQHPGCGFATLTFSEDKKVGIVVINHPETCAK